MNEQGAASSSQNQIPFGEIIGCRHHPAAFFAKGNVEQCHPGRTAPEDFRTDPSLYVLQTLGQPREAEAIAHSGAARAVVLKDQFGFDPELIAEVWRESIKLDRMQPLQPERGRRKKNCPDPAPEAAPRGAHRAGRVYGPRIRKGPGAA